MFDDNGDKTGGQYGKTTFDPDTPGKDEYIGKHYSLVGWKPVGAAVTASQSIAMGTGRAGTAHSGLRVGFVNDRHRAGAICVLDEKILSRSSAANAEHARGGIVVYRSVR